MNRRMREVFLYELRRNIRRKGYLFTTFGVPILAFIASLVLPGLFGSLGAQAPQQNNDPTQIELPTELMQGINQAGYIDETGRIAAPQGELAAAFTRYDDEAAAQAALDAGTIQTYYIIPADYFETGDVTQVLPRLTITQINPDLTEQLLLDTLGEEAHPQVSTRLGDPATFTDIDRQRNTETDSESGFDSRFIVVYVFAIILLGSLFTTNGYLLQSVIEEKETRLIEILLASLRPFELLAGKIAELALIVTERPPRYGAGPCGEFPFCLGRQTVCGRLRQTELAIEPRQVLVLDVVPREVDRRSAAAAPAIVVRNVLAPAIGHAGVPLIERQFKAADGEALADRHEPAPFFVPQPALFGPSRSHQEPPRLKLDHLRPAEAVLAVSECPSTASLDRIGDVQRQHLRHSGQRRLGDRLDVRLPQSRAHGADKLRDVERFGQTQTIDIGGAHRPTRVHRQNFRAVRDECRLRDRGFVAPDGRNPLAAVGKAQYAGLCAGRRKDAVVRDLRVTERKCARRRLWSFEIVECQQRQRVGGGSERPGAERCPEEAPGDPRHCCAHTSEHRRPLDCEPSATVSPVTPPRADCRVLPMIPWRNGHG